MNQIGAILAVCFAILVIGGAFNSCSGGGGGSGGGGSTSESTSAGTASGQAGRPVTAPGY